MTLKHPKAPERADRRPLRANRLRAGGRQHPAPPVPDRELPPDVAYQIIHDELMLDGNARLNLATFVTTWMEPQAEKLMAECLDKNMIDKDEYPQTAELEMRCVNMLSRPLERPERGDAVGCSTTGSSEAANCSAGSPSSGSGSTLLVAVEPEPQEVVVLRHHLRTRPREVERERGHVVAEVVDPEDQVLRQRLGVTPDDPADARDRRGRTCGPRR